MIDTGRVPLSQAELALYRQGISCAASGDLQIAVDCYARLLDLRSDFWEGWYERGTTLEDLGRFSEAIQNYDRALSLYPKREALANIWLRRGNAFQYGLGEYDAALACYDRVLQIQPDNAKGWQHRGNALLYGYHQPETAISSYRRSLELDPQSSLSWRNHGNAFMELQRYSQAIDCYDWVIRLNPEDKIAIQARQQALQELGLDLQPTTTYPVWDDRSGFASPRSMPADASPAARLDLPVLAIGASLAIEDEEGCHGVELSDRIYTIGRDPENDICLRSQFVSRFHAVLKPQTAPDGRQVFQIQDGTLKGKRSTNGLSINGKPIQKAILMHRDLIVFGPRAKATFNDR